MYNFDICSMKVMCTISLALCKHWLQCFVILSNQKHPSCKKILAKTWKKAMMKKMEIKRGSQRMLLITLKKFSNDDPGHKTFSSLNVLRPKSSLSKLLIWSTAFLHRPWPPPFDFASLSSQPFFRSWPQPFLQLGCFWLEFHFFFRNKCMFLYWYHFLLSMLINVQTAWIVSTFIISKIDRIGNKINIAVNCW